MPACHKRMTQMIILSTICRGPGISLVGADQLNWPPIINWNLFHWSWKDESQVNLAESELRTMILIIVLSTKVTNHEFWGRGLSQLYRTQCANGIYFSDFEEDERQSWPQQNLDSECKRWMKQCYAFCPASQSLSQHAVLKVQIIIKVLQFLYYLTLMTVCL